MFTNYNENIFDMVWFVDFILFMSVHRYFNSFLRQKILHGDRIMSMRKGIE